MRILAFKPGHDGGLAYVEDATLVYALEGEKDSFCRYEVMTPRLLNSLAERLDDIPDVVCESGWIKGYDSLEAPIETGYHGIDQASSVLQRDMRWFGRPVKYFSSSHERAHLLCSFGLSDFPQGEPCYALIWEGAIGDFYLIRPDCTFERLGRPLWEPGSKYSFAYHVADEHPEPILSGDWPGKVMALAAYSQPGPTQIEEQQFIDFLFEKFKWGHVWRDAFAWSPFYRIGVESDEFKSLARRISDAIFDRFYQFAERNLNKRYPLVIGGGCGLNCEWNSRWRESGFFADVFVPPCTNDSGAALGTAIDAQFHYTGSAKVTWDVYAGLPFREDAIPPSHYRPYPLKESHVAKLLAEGNVLAWIQGRYEMGPRALGNRSLLAEPFRPATRDRLNQIKRRANYRPVAPICLKDEVDQHFELDHPSPHMLYFSRVRNARLRAVTHVDNSARVQTITRQQNAPMAALLEAFRKETGCGVLCNTSLNFPGRGFINSMHDLIRYSDEHELDGFVVGQQLYLRNNNPRQRAQHDSDPDYERA